jgi:hypothetical protein
MSKTDAGDLMGLKIRIFARENGLIVNKDLVLNMMQEQSHWNGPYRRARDANPSWQTVLRGARFQLRGSLGH